MTNRELETMTMTMTELDEMVARYVAVWNEPDQDLRREQVASLWADDAMHVLQSRKMQGHAEIEERVAAAHRDLVADKGFAFALVGGADGIQAHHDAVTFDVMMAPAAGGDVAWIGRMILLLGDDGRIRCDYQFGRNQ